MSYIKNKKVPVILLDSVKEAVLNRWLDSKGWYLVEDCFKTTDNRVAGTGYSPIRDFPVDEPFLRYLWAMMWMHRRLALLKFRQGMLSNLVIARSFAIGLLFEGSRNYILKRSFKEADDFLEFRIMEIWRNIPEEIEVPLKTRNHINGAMFKIRPKEILPEPIYTSGQVEIKRPRLYGDPLPSSTIEALEGTYDKARGITGFNALVDEAAFMDGLRRSYNAMSPAMQYMQLISSPEIGEFQHCFTIGITANRFQRKSP